MHLKNKLVAAMALAVLFVPAITFAQTMSVAQEQAELTTLLAELHSLEAQVAASGGTGTTLSTNATSPVNSQAATVGDDSLAISADSTTPPAGQIVQNSAGNTLAVFRFSNPQSPENINVTRLNVVAEVASANVKAAFSNVTLWSGSTELGVASAPVLDAAGTGYIYSFNSFTPLVIPEGNSVLLTLKGDAGSYTNESLTDGSTLTFAIATTTDSSNDTPSLTVVAFGATSNQPATITLTSASGNPQQVVRTTVAVVGQSAGTSPPLNFEQLGSITFTANAAGDAKLNMLKLTTNQTSTALLNSLVLHDPNGSDIVAVDGFAKSSVAGNTVTWAFASSSKPLVVTAGSSYTLTLWGNLGQLPTIVGVAPEFTAMIAAPTDFTYYDGTSGTPILLNLSPMEVVPLIISAIAEPVSTINDSLTVSIDPTTPPQGRLLQNSTGNTLAVFRMSAATDTENIKVNALNIVALANTAQVKAGISNVTLWNGSTELGVAQVPVADAAGNGYIYPFTSFANPLIVTAGSSLLLTLKGNVGSYSSGSFTDGRSFFFEIATTTDASNDTPSLAVAAYGATSNQPAAVTLAGAISNPQMLVRSTVAVSATLITSVPSSTSTSSLQEIGSFTLTTSAAGPVMLNYLRLTDNQSNENFSKTVILKDPNGNDIDRTDKLAVFYSTPTSTFWDFLPSTAPLVISAGSSYTMTVWANMSDLAPSTSTPSSSLVLSINAAGDLNYYDAVATSSVVLNLLPNQAPLMLANIPIGASVAISPINLGVVSVDSNAETAIAIQSMQTLLNQLEAEVKAL